MTQPSQIAFERNDAAVLEAGLHTSSPASSSSSDEEDVPRGTGEGNNSQVEGGLLAVSLSEVLGSAAVEDGQKVCHLLFGFQVHPAIGNSESRNKSCKLLLPLSGLLTMVKCYSGVCCMPSATGPCGHNAFLSRLRFVCLYPPLQSGSII